MKAIILGAGQGKRLLPLTSDRPKATIEIAGRSMLDWQITQLTRCGISQIYVVTGFKARVMQDEILSAGGRDWTEAWLAEEIVMKSPRFDDPPSFPRWVMVVQIFNHQTHHRSQVTSALHTMGIDYGSTDIPWRPGAGYFAG